MHYNCQRTKCTSLYFKYAIKLASKHLYLNNFYLFQFFHNEERLEEDIWVDDAWTRAEFLHESVKSTLSISHAELKASVLSTLEGITKGCNSHTHPHTQTNTKTYTFETLVQGISSLKKILNS